MDHQSTLQSAFQSGAQPRSSIPRLSKLPVPRASFDNINLRTIRPMASRERSPLEQAFNLSSLPKSSDHHQAPSAGRFWPADSAVNVNVTASIEGSHNTKARNEAALRKPFGRPALRDDPNPAPAPAPAAAFEPSRLEPNVFVAEQGLPEDGYATTAIASALDENDMSKADTVRSRSLRGRRKPRPSLSDRTIETLAQLPPAHSPARRRPSVLASESPMGPPNHPASSMSASRPGTPFGFRISRPCSPVKQDVPRAASRTPGARRASGPAKPIVIPKPESIAKLEPHTKLSSTVKVKTASRKAPEITKPNPFRGSKTLAARPVQNRPGLSSIFRDLPRPGSSTSAWDPVTGHRKFGASKTKPPSDEASSSASTTKIAPSSTDSKEPVPCTEEPPTGLSSDGGLSKASRSSSALREIISKAKAEAARKTLQSTTSEEASSPNGDENDSTNAQASSQGPVNKDDKMGLLRQRLQGARKDGNLNIAAMRLKEIPDEVLRMYDVDLDSGISWAETVDLTKFIAADNELTTLREDAFPDYTAKQLADDDEKTNYFGGLEVLDLHENMLQTIPLGVRRLERLRILDLSNNALTMPAVHIISQMEWLVGLNLAGNNLSGHLIPEICHLMSLRFLDLRSNKLDSLPEVWQFLGCLEKFNVSDNNLTSIHWDTLADLPPLVEFDASKNKLQGTFFCKSVHVLDTLQVLNLSFNNVDRLTENEAIRFPELHTLALDGNRLSSLPDMSQWGKLATFTASENRFEAFPEGFVNLKNLRNADMSANSLTRVDMGVGSMESLVTLSLVSNPLRDRKYLTMPTDELKRDLVRRAPPLIIETIVNSEGDSTIIELEPPSQPPSRNGWRAEPPRWHAKEGTLDLSFKSLSEKDLHPSNMILDHVIFSLKLSRNILTVFPLQLITNPRVAFSLKTLDLSHNPLREFPESLSLPHLQSLHVASTSLNRLDVLCGNLSLPDLTELDISRNRISGPLPRLRDHFPKLSVLHAADNGFTTLEMEAVRGLRVVDLSNNDIELLQPKLGLLAGKDGLQSLTVSGNKFRVPNRQLLEKGTEAVLTWLRGRIPSEEVPDGEWSGDLME